MTRTGKGLFERIRFLIESSDDPIRGYGASPRDGVGRSSHMAG